MGVATTLRIDGNIVKIINALYIKRYMVSTFNKCQVTAWIGYNRKVNQVYSTTAWE